MFATDVNTIDVQEINPPPSSITAADAQDGCKILKGAIVGKLATVLPTINAGPIVAALLKSPAGLVVETLSASIPAPEIAVTLTTDPEAVERQAIAGIPATLESTLNAG